MRIDTERKVGVLTAGLAVLGFLLSLGLPHFLVLPSSSDDGRLPAKSLT